MISMHKILKYASEVLPVTEEQILSTGRKGILPDIRMAVIYICKEQGHSKREIAKYFDRYESNILYCLKTFRGYLDMGDVRANLLYDLINEKLQKKNEN